MKSLLLCLWTFPCVTIAFSYAMVSKSLDNPFYNMSHQACHDKAAEMGGTCLLLAPELAFQDTTGEQQAAIIDEIVQNRTADAIAVAVMNLVTVGPAIDRAVAAGIPVVTFDSDAPDSQRTSYIGTDNYFFGSQIARVLKQLKPNGGTYAAIADTAPNLQERLRGFLDEIQRDDGQNLWIQAQNSPAMAMANVSLAMEHMHGFAQDNVDHIIPLMGAAMRSGGWKDFVNQYRDRDLTLVSGDAMMVQLELLDRGYAHGLVGQLPYAMGELAIQTLHDILQGNPPTKEFIGTNVLNHLLIPLELPPLIMNHNLIGNMYVVGYILFGLIAALTLAFLTWTIVSRHQVVVKAAQPMFLFLILLGVLLMAGAMIPLSFDDNGKPEEQSDREGALICMLVPWLAFCGFSMTFAALFSKTMRINKMFQATKVTTHDRSRTNVTVQQVLVPLVALLAANVAILTWWTITDPLVYTRQDLPGKDGWNRVISTYGSCQSENVTWYLIPLAIINVGVLVLANWQAYQARHIMAEFTESRYIGLTMSSLLQATGMGVPILFVVRESPMAFYLLLVFMIFVISGAVLVLMFVPKLALAEKFRKHTPEQQSKMIRQSVLDTQSNLKMSRMSTSSLPGGIGSMSEQPLSQIPANNSPSEMRWSQMDFSQMEANEENGNISRVPGGVASTSLVGQSIIEADVESDDDEAPEKGSKEFGVLAEQVEKRLSVHARGSKADSAFSNDDVHM